MYGKEYKKMLVSCCYRKIISNWVVLKTTAFPTTACHTVFYSSHTTPFVNDIYMNSSVPRITKHVLENERIGINLWFMNSRVM